MTVSKFKSALFGTPMVQAIGDNRKTQTRRTQGLELVNDNPDDYILDGVQLNGHFIFHNKKTKEEFFLKPKYKFGDIIWVRETFDKVTYEYVYKADDNSEHDFHSVIKWRPSIYMPKEAARYFLRVLSIKCERLKDISEEDAIAEGVLQHSDYGSTGYVHYGRIDEALTDIDAVYSYETLWDSINGKDSWKKNPWVFVYTFERIEKPKHFLP